MYSTSDSTLIDSLREGIQRVAEASQDPPFKKQIKMYADRILSMLSEGTYSPEENIMKITPDHLYQIGICLNGVAYTIETTSSQQEHHDGLSRICSHIQKWRECSNNEVNLVVPLDRFPDLCGRVNKLIEVYKDEISSEVLQNLTPYTRHSV